MLKAGWDLMEAAAEQGLPEALEQIGSLLSARQICAKRPQQSTILFAGSRCSMGNLNAQIRLAELLFGGAGSPVDYETVYRWLHHSVTADKNMHQRIQTALQKLAGRMPEPVLASGQKNRCKDKFIVILLIKTAATVKKCCRPVTLATVLVMKRIHDDQRSASCA